MLETMKNCKYDLYHIQKFKNKVMHRDPYVVMCINSVC